VAQDYRARLRIPLLATSVTLITPDGEVFSRSYRRVVIGGRGPYLEYDRVQIEVVLHPVNIEHWYFTEWRTDGGIKVYDQIRKVDYADYKLGLLYVSPFDLRDVKGGELVAPPPKPEPPPAPAAPAKGQLSLF
jgi:hypothetical protein